MRVLVTEDDARMASLLGQALLEADHEVRVVGSGERAIDALDEDDYDLVLLDVMLPRLDGFATCRRMRERGGTMGILMLTARDDVEDRVRGLDAGADDYLGKPFSLEELLARVRAFERRGPAGFGPRIAAGELVLDTAALVPWRGGTRIDLTVRECAVLEALMREAGRIVRRDRIVARAWPEGSEQRSNVLEVLIGKIREKIDRPFVTAKTYVASKQALNDALDLGATLQAVAKTRYARPSPYQADPSINALNQAKFTGQTRQSYPSKHTVLAGAALALLEPLQPHRTDEYDWMADEIAFSRMYAGGHYLSDLTAGAFLGTLIGDYERRKAGQ